MLPLFRVHLDPRRLSYTPQSLRIRLKGLPTFDERRQVVADPRLVNQVERYALKQLQDLDKESNA